MRASAMGHRRPLLPNAQRAATPADREAAVRARAVSEAELGRLDRLYAEREDLGALGMRPTGWDALVEELRGLRRAVEAGVVVTVGGATLTTWQEFYAWAHGRYHALEEGADSWIGDDDS